MIKALFAFIFMSQSLAVAEEKPIVVLTTAYNCSLWVERNVNSILNQDYSNYKVVYIDDASQDGTADLVENLVQSSPKEINFNLLRNQTRVGALSNIYHAIHEFCDDDAIVVSLDGDDWFYDDQVLKKINSTYIAREVWITHGTMMEYPSKLTAWSVPIPKKVIARNAFRTYRCPSHLRTFYAWLFKKIRLEDLLYEGEFFTMTWDQAIMFPMMEMAGNRHAFIKDITYVYNMTNPINDNKVNAKLQRDLEIYIRSMPPYERLSGR